jgi:hypothetical protein
MDHAEAHERIADLLLEPDRLGRLGASSQPEDRAFLEHVRGCADCRAELAALGPLQLGLRRALGGIDDTTTVAPIAPPESLRASVLRQAHAEPRAATVPKVLLSPFPIAIRAAARWSAPRWAVGLAAALAIAILGGAAGMQLQRIAGTAASDSAVAVVSTVERVLAADPHWVVGLRTASGAPAGSVAWSHRDFAVLATGLSAPAKGQVYRCWLEWAGKAAPIGIMDFAGETAYWTGSVGAWASVTLDPTARFIVTLESAAQPPAGSMPAGPAVLQADLGT